MDRAVLFFDIDGTVLSEITKEVPVSAINAMKAAQQAGHLLFINTGRTICSIPPEIRRLKFDGYLCGCGTYLTYQDEVLFSSSIEKKRGREILKKATECNLEIVSRFLAGEAGKGVFATAHEGAAQYCRKVDKREIPVCPILGVNIAVINMNWLLKYLAQNIHQLQGDYICVSNVHTTVVSYEDADYRAVQNGGLMAIPDGNPLAQEARRRGYPQIQRTTGPDLMMEVFRQSTAHGWRHYFYGSTQEVQEKMIARLQKEYPGLVIAGTDAPPFRELTPEEDALAVARINQAQPDFVWVGLGAPKQERWMAAHQGRVHGLMIGVGAGFDFFSGNVRRAPLWMQKHSLEWLYRLMQDPKRLFQRYWSTNLKFIWNATIRRK